MANPLSKLKGGNFKELLIDHGEKIGFGLFALLGILIAVFAFMNSEPVTILPEQIDKEVELAKNRIATSTWPEEEQQKFADPAEVTSSAKTLFETERSSAKYQYTTLFSTPLYPPRKAIREPSWLPVENLMGTSMVAVLDVTPTTPAGLSSGEEGSGGSLDPEGQTAKNEEKSRNATDLDLEAGPKSGGRGSEGMDPDLYNGAPPSGPGEGYGTDYAGPSDPGLYSEEYGSGGATSNREGEGRRMVAVRGVFNMRQQIEQIAKALNMNPTEVASMGYRGAGGGIEEFFFIKEFQLQRQEAVAGENPWAGDWKEVDLTVAQEVLSKVANYDPEEVDYAVLDPAISMPLPSRVIGRYGFRVGHPRIKEFKLTGKAYDEQFKMFSALIEARKKIREESRPDVEKGGFAAFTTDVRRLRGEVMGSEDASTSLRRNLQSSMGADGNPQTVEDFMKQITASGNLLLFRYLDFDVEPGRAYRYRVKLVLKNPNYQRPVEELEFADIAHGKLRETPWSNPTDPIVVPEDTAYSLARMSYPRRDGDLPAADLQVYQWYPKTGTVVKAKMEAEPGNFLGGKVETDLIDVAKETWEEKTEVELANQDLLLDIAETPFLDPQDHPELGDATTPVRSNSPVTDFALIYTQEGLMDTLDPSVQSGALAALKTRQEAEATAFESYKTKSAVGEEGYGEDLYDLYGGEYGSGSGEYEGSGGRRKRGGRNPTRLRGRGGSGSAMSP